MKRHSKIVTGLLLLCFLSGFGYAQNTTVAAPAAIPGDSAALKALVVKFLQWHATDKKADFVPLLQHLKDTVYTGIDWQAHKQRVAALEKTNLFTTAFADNYQKIALYLDKELKQNKTKYLVGDLPPYGNETSPWCNCQEYPAGMLKRLQIVAVKIINNTASFKWTWATNFSMRYRLKKKIMYGKSQRWKNLPLTTFRGRLIRVANGLSSHVQTERVNRNDSNRKSHTLIILSQ